MKKELIQLIENILDEGFKNHIPLTAEYLADKLVDVGIILLPCKIGDIVYQIIPKCRGFDCPYDGGYGGIRCLNNQCEAYIEEKEFTLHDYDNIGKTIFVTLEKAEKKLKAGKKNASN